MSPSLAPTGGRIRGSWASRWPARHLDQGAVPWVARVALQLQGTQGVEEGGSLLRGRGHHWIWRRRRWLEWWRGQRARPRVGGCWRIQVLRHGILGVLRGLRCCWVGHAVLRAADLGRMMVWGFQTSLVGRRGLRCARWRARRSRPGDMHLGWMYRWAGRARRQGRQPVLEGGDASQFHRPLRRPQRDHMARAQ